ncbi:hypothetical protein LZ023_04740 [Pseudomonas silvicola]|nr:hypothetical protein LZ023_04740 [Pseudomonas silvicola]
MSNYVDSAEWWRAPQPQLHLGSYHSIILDHGEMTKAVPDSKNQYLFSEVGAGVKTLATVGTALQIVELLERTASRSIVNSVDKLSDIYMGIALYEPKQRFEGVFPLNEVAMDFMKFGIAAWAHHRDSKPEKVARFIAELLKAPVREKQKGRNLIVKLSYLPEKGMSKIASGKISCKALQKMILDHLPPLG